MDSNTDVNSKPWQFKKGDPRINRKGRPKSFDAFRELAQQLAHEKVIKDGEPLIINNHVVTLTEAILRSWATSKNPQLQRAFMEIAFGKVPETINVNSRGVLVIQWDDDEAGNPA